MREPYEYPWDHDPAADTTGPDADGPSEDAIGERLDTATDGACRYPGDGSTAT